MNLKKIVLLSFLISSVVTSIIWAAFVFKFAIFIVLGGFLASIFIMLIILIAMSK